MKKMCFLISMLLFTIAGKAQEITWTELRTIKQGLYDIHCVNDSVLYVCGEGGFIQKSTDAGKTWILLHEENGIRWQVIKFLDEQTGFVGGGEVLNFITPVENGGILRKTTDGGLSWQDITPKDSINIVESIFPIDEDTLYIIQSGILLKTIDAGNSWDTACPLMHAESMRNFYMIDSIGYATAFGYYTGGTKIYRTLDYAQTWHQVYRKSSLILNPNSSDLVFFHPDTIYIYLPDSLLYTTDGFATYERQPYHFGYHSQIKIKRFPNNNYCVVANISNNYFFYGNINGTFFYEDGVPDYIAVDGCSDSIFYVAQYWGKIYTNRYFKPDDTTHMITLKNDSFSVFPNPTTGQLIIDASTSLSTSNGEWRIKNIEIYDIMGKRQKAENRKQNEIDISHLPAGMYFLRIETEKGSITKKIIKK